MNSEISAQTNQGSRDRLFNRVLSLVKWPIIFALVLTPVRFLLEVAGLPENLIFIIGLLWLTLAIAIYWGIKLYNYEQSYLTLFLGLLIFSPISRIPVSVFWWIDRNWQIGTHYADYYDTLHQALLNQVGWGSLIQLIPGFLLGSITLAIMQMRKARKQPALFSPRNH